MVRVHITWEMDRDFKDNGRMMKRMVRDRTFMSMEINMRVQIHHHTGVFINSEKGNSGVYIYSNGDRYEGDWLHDKRSG